MENSMLAGRITSRAWLLAVLGAIALIIALGTMLNSNGMATAVPAARATPPLAARVDPAALIRQNHDRTAARTVCAAAVRHLLGSPPGALPDAQNDYVVRQVGDGVLSIEVRVPLDGSTPGAHRAVYACQATNQTGDWDAESVTQVSR